MKYILFWVTPLQIGQRVNPFSGKNHNKIFLLLFLVLSVQGAEMRHPMTSLKGEITQCSALVSPTSSHGSACVGPWDRHNLIIHLISQRNWNWNGSLCFSSDSIFLRQFLLDRSLNGTNLIILSDSRSGIHMERMLATGARGELPVVYQWADHHHHHLSLLCMFQPWPPLAWVPMTDCNHGGNRFGWLGSFSGFQETRKNMKLQTNESVTSQIRSKQQNLEGKRRTRLVYNVSKFGFILSLEKFKTRSWENISKGQTSPDSLLSLQTLSFSGLKNPIWITLGFSYSGIGNADQWKNFPLLMVMSQKLFPLRYIWS